METNQERAAHLVRHAPGSEHLLELRFGCEVECIMREDDPTDVHATVLDRHDWKGWVQVHNYGLGVEKIHKEKVLKIIGHPITHADLFRALNELNESLYTKGWDYGVYLYDENIRVGNNLAVIPLNYRTIEDIPKDDPCWEQLCNVFGLTPITN